MAYNVTVDERYFGGYLSNSSGYYDAPDLLNEIFVISEGVTAYGTNVDTFFSADIDTYSLGLLNPGEYIVDVDDNTWDFTNFDFGSVSTIQVINSAGYQVASSYGTYSNLNFTVNSLDTFYVSITGPSFGDSQYSVGYSKVDQPVNYFATGLNPLIIGSINDEKFTSGETLTADLLISDLNGFAYENVVVNWYIDKNGNVENLGNGFTYQIQESEVGGYLGFTAAFYDNAGFFEFLGPYYTNEIVQQSNSNQAPQFQSTAITSAIEDQIYSYEINTFDPDGDSLSVLVISMPDWLTINDDGNNGITLTGTPTDFFVGSSKNSVQLSVSDGQNVSYQSFNIDVEEVDNDPRPIFENFPITGYDYLDMMLNGSSWIFPVGVERVLDWAIVDDGQTSWSSDEGIISYHIDYVLSKFEEFIEVDFNFLGWFESADEASKSGSEINYISSDFDPGLFGIATFPSMEYMEVIGAEYFDSGDVQLNRNFYTDLTNASSDLLASLNFVIAHETGHALGLKHPHDDGGTGRPTFEELGIDLQDDVLFTMMAYENTGEFADATEGIFVPYSPMLFDVPALQYLYGERTENINSGDTIHEINSDWIDYVMNYDPSGIDTLDAQTSSKGVSIFLNTMSIEDSYLSYSINADETDTPYSRADGFIGFIENAVGSNYNDFLYDGIDHSYNTSINGNDGDDSIFYLGGNDKIDGGFGNDELILFDRNLADIASVNFDSETYSILFDDYNVSISNVETITDKEGISKSISNLYNEFLNETPTSISLDNLSVDENSPGAHIANISGYDPDGDNLTYSILSDYDGDMLEVDGSVLKFKDGIAADYEQGEVLHFKLMASDPEDLSYEKEFNVNITNDPYDDNNFAVSKPIDNDTTPNEIIESASLGTVVGITAFSEDEDLSNNEVSYTLTNNPNDLFAINANTGVVTVSGSLDYETLNSHNITIKSLSEDGSTNSSDFQITVNNDPLDDPPPPPPPNNDPYFTYDVDARDYFTFQELSGVGSPIGSVFAADDDGDDLVFSITGGSGQPYFEIEKITNEWGYLWKSKNFGT